MMIFLLFLCFPFLKTKEYHIGLNISAESTCENLISCFKKMNETSSIYIYSKNQEIILNETIDFFENVTIYDQGSNNKLVFSGGGIYANQKSITLINIRILFGSTFGIYVENGALILQVNFFLKKKNLILFEKNCEISLIPPYTIILEPLIYIQGETLIIDGCIIKKQNFSHIMIFAKATFQTNFILKNFIFQENILPSKFFQINTFTIIFENITFSQNLYEHNLKLIIFDVSAYLGPELFSKNKSNFLIKNSVISQNFYAMNIFSISNFSFIDIRNSRFGGNFYDCGVYISFCYFVSFKNIMFLMNNNIETFTNDLTQYKKIKENNILLEAYGISIQIEGVSYLQFLSFYLIKNRASKITAGISLYECEFVYLVVSQFISNVLERGMKDASTCVQMISSTPGQIKIERNYFFNNIINNYEENIDEEYAGCSLMRMQKGNISIVDSLFSENLSSKYLCLDLLGQLIKVSNCSFLNHTHKFAELDLDGSKYQKNGVLVIDFYDIVIENCVFESNTALTGSAITIKKTIYKSQFLSAQNCTFLRNIAFLSGHSFYFDFSSSFRLFFMKSCFFVKGVGQRKSATISFVIKNGNFSQSFTFMECFFIKNFGASSASIFEYYPSYPINTFFNFLNCSFLNNIKNKNSVLQGGLFDIWGEAIDDTSIAINFEECIFKGLFFFFINFKIFLDHDFDYGLFLLNRAMIIIEKSIFLNNSGLIEGSICSTAKGKIIMHDSFIFGMISQGGAISIKETSEADLNNCRVSTVTSPRGGMINADSNSQIKINGSYFEDCTSYFGAIIFLSNGFRSVVNIEKAQFFNNFANESLFYLQDCITYIKNCDFNYSGNVLYTYATSSVLEKLRLENSLCLKDKNGCAFYFTDNSISSISEIFITNANENLIFSHMSTIYGKNSLIMSIRGNSEGLFLNSDYSNIDLQNFTFINFENGLIIVKKNKISLSQCYFENQKIRNILSNSVIICFFCEQININNSSFLGLYALTNGSCLFIFQCSKAVIFNSTFMNNTSNNSGGVIFIIDSHGTIQNSTFLKNEAERGGSLAILCSFIECSVNLLHNIFESNWAKLQGGAVKWYYSPPNNISTNIFINNSAKIYGNDIADQPVKFRVIIYEDENSSKIELNSYYNISEFEKGIAIIDQKSGNLLRKIEFFLLDYENKIYFSSEEIIMKVEIMEVPLRFPKNSWLLNLTNNISKNISDYLFVYGATRVFMNEDNSFVFDKINIAGTPNSTIFLKFSLPFYVSPFLLKDNILPNEIADQATNSMSFILPITFSFCQIGEILDPKLNNCIECPRGKYTFFNYESECKTCPEHTLCKGGNNFYIYPGFWRSSNYSSKIYECSFKEFCLGDNGMLCIENHIGKLCEECTNDSKNRITKKNYFGQCLPCILDTGTFAANIFLGILASALLIFLILIFTLKWFSENQRMRIKIIINFIQNLYFIPFWTMIERNTVEFSFFSSSIFNFSRDLLSLDCFFAHFGYNQLLIFEKLIIEIVYFSFILILGFIFVSLYKRILYKKKKYFFQFSLVIYTVHYIIFPFMAKDYFSALNCIEIDGQIFILNELYTKCWDKNFIFYAIFLIFPILIVFLVIIPVVLMSKYLKKFIKTMIYSKKAFKSFIKQNEKNIVFIGYQSRYPSFEKYKFMQKILIILLSAMYERKKIRILFSLFIYSIVLLLTWRKKPFKDREIKILENVQLLIIIFSYFTLFYSTLAESQILNRIIFNALICLYALYFIISFFSLLGVQIQNFIVKIKIIILSIFFLILLLMVLFFSRIVI